MLNRFWLDRRGATAMEYALIAVLVSLGVFVGADLVGQNLMSRFYQPVADSIR